MLRSLDWVYIWCTPQMSTCEYTVSFHNRPPSYKGYKSYTQSCFKFTTQNFKRDLDDSQKKNNPLQPCELLSNLQVGDVFVSACKMESASRVDIIFNISSACCSRPTSRRASKATKGRRRHSWRVITHGLPATERCQHLVQEEDKKKCWHVLSRTKPRKSSEQPLAQMGSEWHRDTWTKSVTYDNGRKYTEEVR